jgi:hypothetical protein
VHICLEDLGENPKLINNFCFKKLVMLDYQSRMDTKPLSVQDLGLVA